MGHRKKHARSASSSSSHDMSSQPLSSSPQSSSHSASSPQREKYNRLSKKDIKQLIKLEKKIEKQEALLRKLKERKAKSILKLKKPQSKKEIQPREQKIQKAPSEDLSEKKKLFITGIAQKYSYEEVNEELAKLLKGITGVTGFRIKRKQGCPTYAFVDFPTHQEAKLGKQKLQSKRIFGEKMVIYYSMDEKKVNIKLKQCFQCKGYGHYARECQIRKIDEETPQTNYKNDKLDLQSEQIQEPESDGQLNVKIEDNPYQKSEPANKRVVRDKFRLSRLLGQN